MKNTPPKPKNVRPPQKGFWDLTDGDGLGGSLPEHSTSAGACVIM